MTDFDDLKAVQADLAFAPINATVLLAPYSVTAPTTIESDVDGSLSVPAEFVSVGHLEKKAGISLTNEIESKDIEAYGEPEPIRTIINKRKTSFDFSMFQNQRSVLELWWATDFSGVTPTATGGVVLEAPSVPGNVYYRAIILGQDDRNNRPIWVYWLLPKVKLSKLDNQTLNDDMVVEYKPTLTAFKDGVLGYSVAQGFAGPGWRDLVSVAGFGTAPTSISAASATETVTASAGASHTKQLVVTGDNGLVYTADCTYSSATPAKATVSASGLVTGVSSGSAVITASYLPYGADTALTYDVTVTVS